MSDTPGNASQLKYRVIYKPISLFKFLNKRCKNTQIKVEIQYCNMPTPNGSNFEM